MTELDENNKLQKIIICSVNGHSIHSPVVRAGVHSCSPVAPQSNVFDGVVVADVPNGEFITDDFRFCPTMKWKN